MVHHKNGIFQVFETFKQEGFLVHHGKTKKPMSGQMKFLRLSKHAG